MSYLLSLLLGVWPRARRNEQAIVDKADTWRLVKVETPLEKVSFYKLVTTNKPKF